MFFISIKIGSYTIFVVAMVTKFIFVLQNLTFVCFILHLLLCSNKPFFLEMAWETPLCHLVSSPLKGTLCHLVSCGGTKWQNDTISGIIIPLSVLDHLVSKQTQVAEFIYNKYLSITIFLLYKHVPLP